jgi:probable HAF family extracellular repeat protein
MTIVENTKTPAKGVPSLNKGENGMRTKSILAMTMAVGGLWAATTSAKAAAYTFTQINVPGAVLTQAGGINNAGEIIGLFQDGLGVQHGFLDSGGSFTTIDGPVPPTGATGINNTGQIVHLVRIGSGKSR